MCSNGVASFPLAVRAHLYDRDQQWSYSQPKRKKKKKDNILRSIPLRYVTLRSPPPLFCFQEDDVVFFWRRSVQVFIFCVCVRFVFVLDLTVQYQQYINSIASSVRQHESTMVIPVYE